MSTAAVEDATAPAKGGSKKKLIIIGAVAALVLAGGGGAAVFMMKKKAAAAAEAEAEAGDGAESASPAKHAAVRHDPKNPPVFVPLDAFTVNLADREAERYAQVGITLEIEDPHVGDAIKSFMPAIRNQILMAIADRSASELLGRDGKQQLAEKVRRETSRVLGADVEDDEPAEEEAKPAKGEKAAKKKKKKAAPPLPIKAVHFSTFIIQ